MVKLSKPSDGNHGSLRDRFPILSSLRDDSGASHERQTSKSRTLSRSKSIFSLAQKFFRLSAEDDASDASNQVLITNHAMEPSSSSSDHSTDDQHSIKAMNHRDAAYYHPNNTRRVTPTTASIPLREQKSWNPLLSIRGKLEAGFLSVRGRNGSVMRSHIPSDLSTTAETPLKRRKSLHGLHSAWGTISKKFTLKGRSRAQAQADFKAYQMQDEDDAIALNDFGAMEHDKEIYRHALSLPSEGLSTSNRRAGSSSDSSTILGSKGRKTPEQMEIEAYINVKKTSNGRNAFSEDCRAAESSCLPEPRAINTRTSGRHVVFLSATQVQLMEEAKRRQQQTLSSSSINECPRSGSPTQNSIDGLHLSGPVLPLRSSITGTASFYFKAPADEQAEIKLIENILSDTCSLDSVDLDASFENRKKMRRARYNLLMDPVQQVKNYEIYTKSVENAARMLKNIGHADVDNFQHGLSFDGPLYTWTDANKAMKKDVNTNRFNLVVDSAPLKGQDGKALHFKSLGDSKVEICNDYNNIVITTTELEEISEPTTPREALTASASGAVIERGRSLSRTPTKNLAVNNRSEKSNSPLKRFKLTPNNSYNRFINNGRPSSTVAVRSSSRASTDTLIEVEHIEDVVSDTFDLSYLSLAENKRDNVAWDSVSSVISADLAAFQAEEDRKFRRRQEKFSNSTVETFVTAMSPGQASVFSETSGIVTPPKDMAAVLRNLSPKRPRSGADSSQKPRPSAKEIEEEFKAFQAEYVARYKKPVAPLNQAENSEHWKKEHWVEGRILSTWDVMVKQDPVGHRTERSTSFTFVAHGQRVRMANFGGSSFFAKTSCSPLKPRQHDELVGANTNRLFNKGKGKSHTFVEEGVFGKWGHNSSYCEKRRPMLMDADFHPHPRFNISSSGGPLSSGAASPPMYNVYGNIVNVWTPEHPNGINSHHLHARDTEDGYFDALQWPPATQDIFRQNYPTNPPGPRSHEQAQPQKTGPAASPSRNADSGYWDVEKASGPSRAMSGSSVYSEQPPIDLIAPSSPAQQDIVALQEEQHDDRLLSEKTIASPHGTAAHILARLNEGRFKSVAVDDETDLRLSEMDGEYPPNSSTAMVEAKFSDLLFTDQEKHDSAANEHALLMERMKELRQEPADRYRSAAPSPESFTEEVKKEATEDTRFENLDAEENPDRSSTAKEILERLDAIEAALEQTQIEDGLISPPAHASSPKITPEDSSSFYDIGKEVPKDASLITKNLASPAEQESNMVFERARALAIMKNALETALETAEEGLELERMAKVHEALNWPAVEGEGVGTIVGTCMPPPADRAQQSATDTTAAMLGMAFEQRMNDAKAATYIKLEALQADRWHMMEIKAQKEWDALQNLATFHTLVNFETRKSERPKMRSMPKSRMPRVLRGNAFKAKNLAVAEREKSPNWKGKAQAWPTFIAFEPATMQHKEKNTPPALPPRNLLAPTSNARSITPQATINGSLGRSGPVSPLTKAWLESKKTVDKTVDFPDASISGEPGWFSGSLRGRQLMPHSGNERTTSGNRSVSSSGKLSWNRAVSGGIEPIRGMRPSMCTADRTVSGMSVATAVDDSFGEDLMDFRSEVIGEDMETKSNGEDKRVASWMLYG